VDTDDKGPYMLQSEAENVTKELMDKKATGHDNVPGYILTLSGRVSLKQTTDQQHTQNWRVTQGYNLALLAKQETVIHSITHRLIEVGRCYEIKMNVEKTRVIRSSRQPSPALFMRDQKQMENAEYFKHLGRMITNDARCTCKIKTSNTMAKAALNKKMSLTLGLHLRKKSVTCYILSIALYGTETWILWKVDQKHLEGFEMRCWRRMGKINWTNHVKKEAVLHRVTAERNTLHMIKKDGRLTGLVMSFAGTAF
jgi:hypothetical protein